MQQNILQIPTELTVNNYQTPATYEYYCYPTTDCIAVPPTGDGWIPFWDDCSSGSSTIVVYFREYKVTTCLAGSPYPPAGAGWTLDTNDCATTNQSKYVRIPPAGAPPSGDVVLTTCISGVPVNPNDFVGPISDYWQLVCNECVDSDPVWWNNPPVDLVESYTHGRNLQDVLLFLAQGACPDIIGIVSDFFEINADGSFPTYTPGINYVTGAANQVSGNTTIFVQKSDVLDPTASQPATVGNMTFNKLMQYLDDVFNVKWFVMGDNNLRLEHRLFFRQANIKDLTVGEDGERMIGQNKYSYLNDERPKTEYYKWMEAQSTDFVGAPITYPAVCVSPQIGGPRGNTLPILQENSVTHNVDQITTDIEYILAAPSEISPEGFVLFSTTATGGGNFTINSEVGLLTNNAVQNGHLSWANLHYNYHRYYRVLLEGYMNNIPETFFSMRPTKQQENVIQPDCCGTGIDDNVSTDIPYPSVTTVFGEGTVAEYKKRWKTNQITMKLLYEQ
jgi:hypothetical protein